MDNAFAPWEVQTTLKRNEPCSTLVMLWLTEAAIIFDTGSGKLSCDEKQEILDVHNGLRQMLANGLVPNQPAAINLREMVRDIFGFYKILEQKALNTSRAITLFLFFNVIATRLLSS